VPEVEVSTQVLGAGWPPTGDVFNSACATRTVLDHITSKWAVLVLAALDTGPMRFSALRRRIDGVSEKMLAQTLRTLEADGFLEREVAPTMPPQVTYRLSPLGADLTVHLSGLLGFINTRIPDIQASRKP
jgi:DNA-binding HxlR family transcriptional regulator